MLTRKTDKQTCGSRLGSMYERRTAGSHAKKLKKFWLTGGHNSQK